MRAFPRWWPAVGVFVALLLAPPASALAGPAVAALPDSVLATVGPRSVTRAEFLRQWENLAPELRPSGKTTAGVKRAFLGELINKEALSLVTEETGFTPTSEESTRLVNLRVSLARQEYYRRMVLDSLPPAGGGGATGHDPARAGERESKLIDRLVAPLAARFDDSTAATLAHAFSLLPRSREEGPGWMRLQVTSWPPPVLPGDTSRVLATSSLGRLTVGGFLWFWARVPIPQRDRPDSPQAVIEWAKSFLAQGLIDAECARAGYDRLPQVEAQIEARRRILAVENYYERVVVARVDTSDTRLEAAWKRDPARFDGPPFDRYHALWYAGEAEARAAAAALARGAPWDSLLDARYPAPADAQAALVARSEANLYRDPQVLTRGRADSTLAAWFAGARAGQTFGPRLRAGQWWIYRYLGHDDGRRRTFAEARPDVLQQVLADEGEAQLTAHLAELRDRYGVRTNESALAALAVPSGAPGQGPPSRRRGPAALPPRAHPK